MSSSECEYHSAEEEEPRGAAEPVLTAPLTSRLEHVTVEKEEDRETTRDPQQASDRVRSRVRDEGEREEERSDSTREDVLGSTSAGPESLSDHHCAGVTDGSEGVEGAGVMGEGGGMEGERVSGLDNRYVSEDVVVKGKEVELTEEQEKELREQANKFKKEGNDSFRSEDYQQAVELYSEALELYPAPSCGQEIAICFANRAACYAKMGEHEHVIEDCTKAVELKPDYLKAWVRRAQAREALEKYEEALEDYKKVLELDPSQRVAQQAVTYLPEKVKEQHEKLKAEMLGKLKELGNVFLKPFGLSTDNFQLQQDPNSGGYSVNFKK